MIKRILIVASFAPLLIGCEPSEPKNFDFTVEGIKTLSARIKAVTLTPQIKTKGTYFVQIDINKDPFTGGAQDWNSISSDVRYLSTILLSKPEVDRINFAFRSTENKNLDWAYVLVDREKLPQDWQDITYHQFFGFSDPKGGTLQASQWLCDYYKKYESAQPHGHLPHFCIMKD